MQGCLCIPLIIQQVPQLGKTHSLPSPMARDHYSSPLFRHLSMGSERCSPQNRSLAQHRGGVSSKSHWKGICPLPPLKLWPRVMKGVRPFPSFGADCHTVHKYPSRCGSSPHFCDSLLFGSDWFLLHFCRVLFRKMSIAVSFSVCSAIAHVSFVCYNRKNSYHNR